MGPFIAFAGDGEENWPASRCNIEGAWAGGKTLETLVASPGKPSVYPGKTTCQCAVYGLCPSPSCYDWHTMYQFPASTTRTPQTQGGTRRAGTKKNRRQFMQYCKPSAFPSFLTNWKQYGQLQRMPPPFGNAQKPTADIAAWEEAAPVASSQAG